MSNTEVDDNLEKNLRIDKRNLRRNVSERTTKTELERIKEVSDENFRIIEKYIDTECNEIKRNTIVNLIAALDYYVREIILWGITAITQDRFSVGSRYDSYNIPVKFLKYIFEGNDCNNEDYKTDLREEVIDTLSSPGHTYQKWGSIKKGLKYILPIKTYNKVVELVTGKDGSAIFQVADLKKLNTIRNNIVHHFSRDYSNDSERKEIDRDIKKDIELVKTIIDSMHKIIVEYEEEESNRIEMED